MHDDAAASPTCRQCHAAIDVGISGFVDLTNPVCAACASGGATASTDAEVVDLTTTTHGRLGSAVSAGRAHRPAIRDLVRSVAGAVSRDGGARHAGSARAAGSTVTMSGQAEALAGRGGGVQHDLGPAAPIDLRDGASGAGGPDPSIWTDPEERAALRELLNRTRPLGIEVLHDRQGEGTFHPIDHLVVAPSGVWVIESMGETGRVQGSEASDFLRPAWRLYIGGVDRSVLLDDVRRRAGVVRNVLVANGEGRVPVRPLLCFSDAALGPVTPPFVMTGVLVTSRRHVVEPFSLAPGLDRASRRWVRDILADHLPATA